MPSCCIMKSRRLDQRRWLLTMASAATTSAGKSFSVAASTVVVHESADVAAAAAGRRLGDLVARRHAARAEPCLGRGRNSPCLGRGRNLNPRSRNSRAQAVSVRQERSTASPLAQGSYSQLCCSLDPLNVPRLDDLLGLGAVKHLLVVRVQLVLLVVGRIEKIFELVGELVLRPQEVDMPVHDAAFLVVDIEVDAVAIAAVLGGLEGALQ
eukprot:6864653-Prymnesium_polylepis.1